MTEMWTLAALWVGLALVATLLPIWLRIATALSEIVVGTIAQLVIGAIIGGVVLGTDQSWIKFLSGAGAILLTFLAGAELDPVVFRERWKEAIIDQVQYSGLVAAVFGSAVVPTLIANAFYLPRHLLPNASTVVDVEGATVPVASPRKV
jgi:Kef-type K+ transport system membrane component KefB